MEDEEREPVSRGRGGRPGAGPTRSGSDSDSPIHDIHSAPAPSLAALGIPGAAAGGNPLRTLHFHDACIVRRCRRIRHGSIPPLVCALLASDHVCNPTRLYVLSPAEPDPERPMSRIGAVRAPPAHPLTFPIARRADITAASLFLTDSEDSPRFACRRLARRTQGG